MKNKNRLPKKVIIVAILKAIFLITAVVILILISLEALEGKRFAGLAMSMIGLSVFTDYYLIVYPINNKHNIDKNNDKKEQE